MYKDMTHTSPIPVLFRLYAKISLRPDEIPPLARWGLTLPMVLRSPDKREMDIRKVLWKDGILPFSPGLSRRNVFAPINRP